MAESPAPDGLAVELLLRFTRAAHEAGGYPANELELRSTELAQALALPAVQVSATPTSVELTVGSIPDQQVYSLRVRPQPVDLYAMGRLDEIAAGVSDGRIDHRQALEQIEALGQSPLKRPFWVEVAARGVVAGALAPILGGGWNEAAAATVVGIAVGILVGVAGRSERSRALVAPLGACLASFLASGLAHAGVDIAVADVTLASIVPLLPGMTMATGIGEVATGHLQSGLANIANAIVQFVGLVFGVGVGTSLTTSWFGTAPVNAPDSLPQIVQFVAAALVGLAFVVTLHAPAHDAIWTCSAAVLAIVANHVAIDTLGDLAGTFVSALIVGLAGHTIARQVRRSALAFIVPGILLLVPGSIGFQSASSLLADQTVTGIDTAFDTFVAMLAIAYGLVASTLMLPDRPVNG